MGTSGNAFKTKASDVYFENPLGIIRRESEAPDVKGSEPYLDKERRIVNQSLTGRFSSLR